MSQATHNDRPGRTHPGLLSAVLKPKWRNRFESRVQRGAPGECWPWAGTKNPRGYGVTGAGGKTLGAHVVAWMIANDRLVAPGMQVDHLCFNTSCVNPGHLEVVTPSENTLRAQRRRGSSAAVKRLGSYTYRNRGGKVMVIWHEYLEDGRTRQAGKTFPDGAEAREWARGHFGWERPYAS